MVITEFESQFILKVYLDFISWYPQKYVYILTIKISNLWYRKLGVFLIINLQEKIKMKETSKNGIASQTKNMGFIDCKFWIIYPVAITLLQNYFIIEMSRFLNIHGKELFSKQFKSIIESLITIVQLLVFIPPLAQVEKNTKSLDLRLYFIRTTHHREK